MGLNSKYRVHEIGKDFNLKSVEILDLLTKYFGESKNNHMTALTDKELDLIFDYYTQNNQVSNMSEYFDTCKEIALIEKVKADKAIEEKVIADKIIADEKAKEQKIKDEVKKAEAVKVNINTANIKENPKTSNQIKGDESIKVNENINKTENKAGTNTNIKSNIQENKTPENITRQQPLVKHQQGVRIPQTAVNANNNEKAPAAANSVQKPNPQFHHEFRPNTNKKPVQPKTLPNLNRNQPVNFRPNENKAPSLGVTIVEKDEKAAINAVGKDAKLVDTRTPINVNLAKYDERLDEIVGDKANKDYGKSKQRIKNKNRKQVVSKKEDELAKLKRLEQYEKDKKKHLTNIILPEQISVNELAAKLRMTNTEVVKKLMVLGIMASSSQIIDYDTASLVAEELGAKVSKEVIVTIEDRLIDDTKDIEENLVTRSPVVVVMGHVDHGKTSLLDAIRNTSVVSGEAGGITQHIGAYKVNTKGRDITFLDTPGHAAFTAMRARGAQVTDVVILVVAGDDGIMPQTVEAINHAKAAEVPIIVAVNKMDKPNADFNRVRQSLTEYGLVPEEWGGDVISVPVSATKHEGIEQLLEMILLVSDMRELKANPNRDAKGSVIEAKLDKGRGPVATVLVQNGTLRTGDVMVAGASVGRVRIMTDDKGRRLSEALPSTPVEVVGLADVPAAGDLFYVVKDERMARELVEQRKHEHKEETFKDKSNISLDELFSQIKDGNVKELNLIVKADVQGSVEAVCSSLEKLSNEEVRVKVIHSAVGSITESDVMLATASKAIIIGFNVRPDTNAKATADKDSVEIRLYRIIYDCIEEMELALKGMLEPKFKEVILGSAMVRQVFKVTGAGTIAGCYVKNGKILRSAEVRLVRDGIVVYEGKVDSLKRFKDDAKEVAEGYECGIGLDKFNDVKENDMIEAFIKEQI
ncbi:MAG: infB [Clostridia bacterium]|nr:infB [Clostridia bacterium]